MSIPSLNQFFRTLLLTCLVSASLFGFQAYATEPVKIGVLAFRPKPQTLAQWQPLAVVLKQALPEHDFEVQALSFPELEKATANKQLDFVLTNPAHYILLTKRYGLSAPLATLATNENGQRATMFGGVIFTRTELNDINNLTDIKNKSIAATDVDSFGGYMMQAYELSQVGITLKQRDKLVITGMPHDNVVSAVVSGRADVGFVRTGVLESMVREGKLDIKKIKIINRQKIENFQVSTSTRLYPEWAFSYMPSVDENLARHIAAALFVLEENTPVTRAMNIHGFTVPADYAPVTEVLKELRVKPFDVAPSFTLRDVWVQYKYLLIGALVVLSFIGLLVIRLILTKRKLNSEHQVTLTQQKRLHDSEYYLRTIINSEPECIKIVDVQGHLIAMNPAGLAMLEADSFAQIEGQPVLNVIAPEYRTAFTQMHKRVIAGETVQMEFEVVGLKGSRRLLETHAVPLEENGRIVHLAITRDITQRKAAEATIKSNAAYTRSLIEASLDPLVTINTEGKITDVNTATENVTGIDRASLFGSDFASYFTDPVKARTGYLSVFSQGSVIDYPLAIRHVSGKVTDVLYNASLYKDSDGKVLGVFAAARDVTERKATETKLRMLSTAIEQSPASVTITDLDAKIEYVNPRFTRITGYSEAEVIGQNPRVLQSGLTEKSVYDDMWSRLTQGKRWVGEFINKNKNGDTFYEEAYISPVTDDDGTVTHYVAVKLDVTKRKQMEEEVHQLAFYDALTKLPNRRLLNDRLNQAIAASKRSNSYAALMFLDLDNFKPLNDTHGHEVGDMLLMEAANRLTRCIREMDTVARFGGDEFVVMLSELGADNAISSAQAAIIAEKIRAALSDPYNFTISHADQPDTHVEHLCTASIGVIMFNGSEGSQDDFMKWADAAMYEAKEAGRNQIRFYGMKN